MKANDMADDVDAFINAIKNPTRKADAKTLLEIFRRVTGQPAKFWPPSIIGFGDYHYKYESGRCLLYTSPSPRDATLSRMPSSA